MEENKSPTRSMSASKSEDEYIEDWLKKNEGKAEVLIENWLCSHPQPAKNLYLKYGHYIGMEAMTPLSTVRKTSMKHFTSSPTIQARKRKPTEELRKLDRQELFVELLKDVVAPDVNVYHLTHKILVNVLLLTHADRSSLFLVEGSGDDQILVSRLFDVSENSTVNDAIHDDSEAIKMAVGVGVAGKVAETGETINLTDAYEDPRFNRSVDVATGYKTKSILCMPIKTADGQVIGVAQVINKVDGGIFTKEDEEDFQMYLNFCAIGLVNAQLFDQSFGLSRRLQILLHLAKGLFEDTTKMEVVMNKVMEQSMELIPCQCCSVLLLENDSHKEAVSFSQIFQIDRKLDSTLRCVDAVSDIDVVKHVATTAEPIILSSIGVASGRLSPTTKHLVLSKDTESILCIPIFNSDGEVLGIMSLTNKLDHPCFSRSDVESLELFGTFCGLGLHNVMMYEKIAVASARNKVAFEILSFHASSGQDDASRLMQLQIPESSDYNLCSFKFDDYPLTEDHTVLASVRIFIDSGMVEAFKINANVLYRWVLTVKKNYRPVTYHNWRHAFNVAQMMFAMFEEGKLTTKLSKLEQLALLIACFCHDLDHRGTNNAFQVKSGSVLAQLYSTSTMEHHHFDHCIMILNSEGNQILNGLSSSKYGTVLSILESAILSTDLSLYLKRKESFKESVQTNTFQWEEEQSRDLLRGMMMTACDVAAIGKPWRVQKRVASMVANEFFEQGDLERNDLQVEPIAMMDRRKKDELPKMQVGFIDFVCMPLYKMLSDLLPDLDPLLEGVKGNRKNWHTLAQDPKATISDPDYEEVPSGDGTPDNPPATTYIAPTTSHFTSATQNTPNTNGPVEGWPSTNSNSSSSAESSGHCFPHHRKSRSKSSHAEVASTRRHLKRCAMS